jgi:hypothetical protein
MTTTDKAISDQVLSITNDLEQGITITQQDIDEGRYDEGQYEVGDILSAWDYLNDALDIEYTVNGAKEYRGASILVAFGGPNITINTKKHQVEAYWWGESYIEPYHTDAMELDSTCEELFDCQ